MPAEATLPLVTIAIPCLDEESYIESCIGDVLAQSYPAERLEILVADGGSMDATREILARMAKDDARIRVIDNPHRIQAAGMNAILREAKGEVIVRMDVHCDYAKDYVRTCVEVLARTGADNVGGAARARAKTGFQRALCAALASPLGVGGAKYRSANAEGFVDTVPFGAFRRSVFERIGMYDPGAITNEDAELNQRLIAAGGKVYLSKEIVVHYYPRDSFEGLAKQYFKYGRGRVRTLLRHKKLLSPRPAIPFLMVVTGVTLAVTGSAIAPFAATAYALATGAEAIRVGSGLGWTSIPTVWAIFPVLHVSHGIGFATGLVQYGLLDRSFTTAPPPFDPVLG